MFQDIFIYSLLSLGIGFLTGWYVGERGMAGVRTDLLNAKQDIAVIKARLDGTPQVISIPTPAA